MKYLPYVLIAPLAIILLSILVWLAIYDSLSILGVFAIIGSCFMAALGFQMLEDR